MSIEVIEVTEKKDLKDFIQFPYTLYRKHPVWVPPLRCVVEQEFNRNKNGFFKKGDAAFFIIRSGKQVKGRIAAFINRDHLKRWKDDMGFFGSFDSVNNRRISRPLFDACFQWLSSRGMKHVHGPYNFAFQNSGFLIAGFDQPHAVISPYNFPYYNELAKASGLVKIKDASAYYGKIRDDFTFSGITGEIAEKHGVVVRTIDMKRLDREISKILKVANEAGKDDIGYIPIDESKIDGIVGAIKYIADPNSIFIVKKGKKPIGYAIMVPDCNDIIKRLNGRLLPFGIFQLKRGMKEIGQYRLWTLGVIPEFQGKDIDTLLYSHIGRFLKERNARFEVISIYEDRPDMLRAAGRFGLRLVKVFRIYQKDIGGAKEISSK